MRRLLLALASTAAGLAAVLSYKTHGTAVAATVTGTQGGGTSAPAASPGTASGPSLAGSATPAPRASTARAAGTARAASTAGAAATRTFTGAVANTQYGPMQVQVTVLDSKITGVRVLQHTDTGTESQQIDATAIPQLTRETLAAQSARIDAVSGASYTSAGYIQSLQSALDKAGGTVRSG